VKQWLSIGAKKNLWRLRYFLKMMDKIRVGKSGYISLSCVPGLPEADITIQVAAVGSFDMNSGY
jgi:hypothetical protein